ncbi:MAG: hypothetical protein M3460_12840 [Actinomycetota bacterium]|nr:hypothetical protein [Actinomycetota bacterium]
MNGTGPRRMATGRALLTAVAQAARLAASMAADVGRHALSYSVATTADSAIVLG